MAFFTTFFTIILQWYVWVPVVILLGYLTWRNNRQVDVLREVESELLILEIPRANDKSELAAEQMFASLHGCLLYTSPSPRDRG